jgi:Csm1 subunit domain B
MATSSIDYGAEATAAPAAAWVNERIALTTSIQALYVLASRVAASLPSSTAGGLLESAANALPHCLSSAIRAAGTPNALLHCLAVPPSATPYIDHGWALSVGENRARLKSPGADRVVWNPRLRLRPMIAALHGANDGTRTPKPRPPMTENLLVYPLAHPDGYMAAPIRLADELQRAQGPADVWKALIAGASTLPRLDDLSRLSPWLWHFDDYLKHFLHGIPAYCEGIGGQEYATRFDTLYDQSRLAGAIAVALSSHYLRNEHKEPPLLLISGEMKPIQDYILGFSPTTPLDVDLILRGRSSFLTLVVNIAAYRLCAELRLPPGSVLMTAASKFTILAPNTEKSRHVTWGLRLQFDQWALDELYGQTHVSLAMTRLDETQLENNILDADSWKPKNPQAGHTGLAGVFGVLADRRQESRFRGFQLCRRANPHSSSATARWSPPIVLKTFEERLQSRQALCLVDAKSPATHTTKEGWSVSETAAFQLSLADVLAAEHPTAVLTDEADADPHHESAHPSMQILGYRVELTSDLSLHPALSEETQVRWDLRSWTTSSRDRQWSGLCRKPLAVYSYAVPDSRNSTPNPVRQLLKGDIDHLGAAFQKRIPYVNLARVSSLSREIENFFCILVPNQLATLYPALVTVLTGGDDFIFLGPSASIMDFSIWIQQAFTTYCGGTLWLSAGLSDPFGSELSLDHAVAVADDALSLAKVHRNEVAFLGETMSWEDWGDVLRHARRVGELMDSGALSEESAAEAIEFLQRSAQSGTCHEEVIVQWNALLRRAVNRLVPSLAGLIPPANILTLSFDGSLEHMAAERYEQLTAALRLAPSKTGVNQVLLSLLIPTMHRHSDTRRIEES